MHSQFIKVVDLVIVSFFRFRCLLFSSFLLTSGYLHAQEADTLAIFILKGKTLSNAGKAIPNVTLELRRNDSLVSKFLSGKTGKFYIEIEMALNEKNKEYVLYVSKEGMIPKTLNINTQIPKQEFLSYTYDQYDFYLEIIMLNKSNADKLVTIHSGTIRWSSKKEKFILDDVFSKVAPKEKDDMSLSTPPLEDIEPPLLPMQMETKSTDTLPTKTESNPDSHHVSIPPKNEIEIQKVNVLINKKRKETDGSFDLVYLYPINVEKNILENKKHKDVVEKGKNISTKYETSNVLTSLLNVVDEHYKKSSNE